MIPFSIERPQLDPPLRLGHLPVVADILRRMGIADIIDQALPSDPRHKVSHGECVTIIIIGVFAGEHSLWRLRDRLAAYDMVTIMNDAGFLLSEYHDDRLGKTLDALWKCGLDRLMTDTALRVIEAFSLDTRWQSFDTTSLSFYGAYENAVDEVAGITVPKITHGYAKNKRFDLKQIVYGSLVTHDGGVPLLGAALDGNASDIAASAHFMERMRGLVADPREVAFVADCKGWNPRVLEQSRHTGIHVLSRLERGRALSKKLMAARPQETESVLIGYNEKHQQWDYRTIAGTDETYSYTITTIADDKEQTETSEVVDIAVRALVCFSSKLYRQKEKTLDKMTAREHTGLALRIKKWEKRSYTCIADAEAALQQCLAESESSRIVCRLAGSTESYVHQPKRANRGRPKKDSVALPTETRFRLRLHITKHTDDERKKHLRDAATFILIRTRQDDWNISDEDMVHRYTQQWRCEHGFAWLKSRAAINPVFAESPHRVATLCYIYTLSLMVNTLIQRNVRAHLKETNTGLPYHRNKPSAHITTRFFFELFQGITTQRMTFAGKTTMELHGHDAITRLAIAALGSHTDPYKPILARR